MLLMASIMIVLLVAAILVARHLAAKSAGVGEGAAAASGAADPFADFRAAVSKHFTPVAEHFGLRTVTEKTIHPETYIEFRGPASKITVAHALWSGSWVGVTVTTAGGHDRRFGLHTIVEAQTRSTDSFNELAELHDVDAEVRVLAELTREHAGSVLSERTASLRELHLLSGKSLREREREMGLDRATDPQPDLTMLFRACEPGFRPLCAYAAVVDFSYSTADVAAFLKIAESDVQYMIAQHDTIR